MKRRILILILVLILLPILSCKNEADKKDLYEGLITDYDRAPSSDSTVWNLQYDYIETFENSYRSSDAVAMIKIEGIIDITEGETNSAGITGIGDTLFAATVLKTYRSNVGELPSTVFFSASAGTPNTFIEGATLPLPGDVFLCCLKKQSNNAFKVDTESFFVNINGFNAVLQAVTVDGTEYLVDRDITGIYTEQFASERLTDNDQLKRIADYLADRDSVVYSINVCSAITNGSGMKVYRLDKIEKLMEGLGS